MALREIGNVCLFSYNIAKVSNVWRAQEKNLQKTVPRKGLTNAPGGLTLLRLATEVELGPLRRHYEQQGGHKGGHGGVRCVPSRESTESTERGSVWGPSPLDEPALRLQAQLSVRTGALRAV